MKRKMQLFKVLLALAIICHPVSARAEGEASAGAVTLNQFMNVQERVEAKEAPESSAETIITYEAGDTVYVTGETDNGWLIVLYQGKTGYIPVEMKGNLQKVDLDIAGLDAEMEAEIAESRMVVEEVERYQAEVKRSRIWGVVIVLLVVAIFAVGIISAIQVKRQKEGGANTKVKKSLRNQNDLDDIQDLDDEDDE